MKRKCNYPSCKRIATIIIPFGSIGASDAYCDKHKKVEDRMRAMQDIENKCKRGYGSHDFAVWNTDRKVFTCINCGKEKLQAQMEKQ
jgi:hypothetical protein